MTVFINDKIVYVQLQKTACTHIGSVLHALVPGDFRGKHSPIQENVGNRLVVGSVRNPWDWYVSLWAYGCLGRGAIHTQLTNSFPATSYRMARSTILHPVLWPETTRKIVYNSRKNHREWIHYYEDADDPELFRAWLKALLSEKGKRLLMEDYPVLPLRDFTGLMTFRFLQLHVDYRHWRRYAKRIGSKEALQDIYRQRCIIDRFVRMEQLEDDLSDVLDEVCIAHTTDDLMGRKKTNSSKRREASYYYDAETIELVGDLDSLISEEFGYNAPRLSKA